jgi:hypothetical protein
MIFGRPAMEKIEQPQQHGEAGAPGIVALDPDIYRDMRWCSNCGGQRVFLEVFEFEGGRVGICLGCGEERIALFTRTTTNEVYA